MPDQTHATEADIAAIRHHVETLFEAYLAGDRDTLRRGRLDNWQGFQVRSTHLIRGVDDYMDELERVLGTLKVERYEFLEFDVQLLGDVALVYYIARDWLVTPRGRPPFEPPPRTVLIRALDVYRRIDGAWLQSGSNISAIADDPDA